MNVTILTLAPETLPVPTTRVLTCVPVLMVSQWEQLDAKVSMHFIQAMDIERRIELKHTALYY